MTDLSAKIDDRTPTRRAPRPFDVRPGDEWVVQKNDDGLCRVVVDVDDECVYYRQYGSAYEQACSRATFWRWCRGAVLSFATDWAGRYAHRSAQQEPQG